MNVEALNDFEKTDLLRLALYFMPMDAAGGKFNREYLMRERPQVYNKLCERDIVEVRYVEAHGRQVV